MSQPVPVARPLLIALLALSGCSLSNKEILRVRSGLASATNTFGERVQSSVGYDPYGNELHYDVGLAQSQVPLFRSTAQNNVSPTELIYLDRDQGHRNIVLKRARETIGKQWLDRCQGDLSTAGFAICQVGYPKGDVNFGNYSVPVSLLTWGGVITGATYQVFVERYDFAVSGQGRAPPPAAAPPVSPPAAPDGQKGDVKARLQKVQELLEAGIITEQEAQQKRQEILDSL